jgi:HEAT repeat protein
VLLQLIWSVALVLIAACLVTLAGLAGHRACRSVTGRRSAARRQRLRTDVLAYLEDQLPLAAIREVLGPGGEGAFVPVLRELAEIVRGKSRSRLIALGRELGVVARVLRTLDHWRPADRARAAHDLRLFDEPRVVAALRARLADRSAQVRLAAAQSMVRLGTIDDLSVLLHQLSGPGGRAPPRTLGRVFRELAPTHGPELVALVRSDAPVAIREHALDALGTVADIGGAAAIRAIASDPAAEVRIAGLRALERLAHPAAGRAIRRALADPEPAVRIEAARCAGQLALDSALDELRRLLEDELFRVRKAGAQALGRLGPTGRAVLQQAAADDPNLTDLARAVLGSIA